MLWHGSVKSASCLLSAATAGRLIAQTKIVTPAPPGVVWDARVRIAPVLNVRVRDAYVDGQGVGQGLLSALTLSQEQGRAELNEGELYRYLADANLVSDGAAPIRRRRLVAD